MGFVKQGFNGSGDDGWDFVMLLHGRIHSEKRFWFIQFLAFSYLMLFSTVIEALLA